MTSNFLTRPQTEHCWSGVAHSGDAKGVIETIAGAETYLALPQEGQTPKGVILFYADVFGPMYNNNKLLQDWFGSQGFITVGIDYFEGDPVHVARERPGYEQKEWIERKLARAAEMLPSWLEAIQQRFGTDLKYCGVGYCFGAPFVMEDGTTGKIKAAAIVHPAFLKDHHFQNIKAPLFLSCSEIDHTFGLAERRRSEDILIEENKEVLYHFQVFGRVKHGFAIRGDPEIENERWAKEESARSIVGWFERFSK